MTETTDFGDEDQPYHSKSQSKREDLAVQALGTRLASLSKAQIEGFPASETLRAALMEWKRISSHEARRRHIKRIGKLVRDHNIDDIELAMDKLDSQSSLSMRATKMAQRWCDRLVAEGKPALTEFMDEHPDASPQRLGQLLRKVKPDAEATKPSAEQRELMRFVRQQVIHAIDRLAR